MSRRIPFGASIATAAEMRAAEQAVIARGVSVDDLMETAGLAVAREVRRFAAGRPILVLAGPGNNGGDAYVAARHLAGWGCDVMVAAQGQPGDGAAARMAAQWKGPTIPLGDAAPRPILVDGLFGTGASRPLDAVLAGAVSRLADAAELVIAIDLPSGIDADAMRSGGGVRASITVALGALKPAHLVGLAAGDCGHVLLANIGVPVHTAAATVTAPMLEALPGGAQKFSRGMVAVVGGAMPGASLLAATAAMHGGAGYVVLAERHPSGVRPHALVRRAVTTAGALTDVIADDRIGAVVVGPGLGRADQAEAALDAVLASPRDLVIDADALSLLGESVCERIDATRRQVFLTPHSGEFDRLFGQGEGNKIDRTRAAAAASGATVVHKGADTVIAAPDGTCRVFASATPWLSTAGTGDVLAGLLGSRHARHRDRPVEAAVEAVWLHAAAAARLTTPFIADQLVDRLPAAMAAARCR
jgi:hydroxyethylthiazole kinase-like uncharacterized protein yjeF